MASPQDWAYLAGIVDGEGHLSIGAHISPGKTYVLRPALDVGNTDKKIIDFCHNLLNGHSRISVSKKNRKTPYYRLQVSSKDLVEPLDNLLPYLVAKKEIAEHILHFLSLHQRWHGYSEEEIEIANRVRAMSRKNEHQKISLDKVVITLSNRGYNRALSTKNMVKEESYA